ncbi:uncharacterized protein LOC128724408 [Anopheles nili]|uniref:uncharacterized protein LOC128724408 n=1 Tax=Anopheles nili TaxID=185578 RepID=UPI00237A522D|nr:uncharacterized protein LOC128724408 [Anopheles nili]
MGRENDNVLRGFSIVIFVLFILPSVSAQECSSPTLTFGGQFPIGPEISATVGSGYTLAQHDVSNIRSVSVKATATDLPVYIDAQITNGKLTLTTNQQFTNYEKLDDKLVFFNVVVFTCASGAVREMTFRQSIKEENNHSPLFSMQSYDIKVPLPLPREFNIQQFVANGQGVVANDYDITKNKVTFSIDENDIFLVTSSSGSSRTEFVANLITKQTLTKIQPPITLRITARDEWVPARTSQATLTISGDPVITFIVPPVFEQSLYRTTYKIGDSFAPFRVNLVSGTYDSTVRYEVTGEDAAYFLATPAQDGNSATITLRGTAQIPESKSLLSFSLSASRTGADSAGWTAVVVELTVEPKVVPSFEASFYTGTIDSGKVISVQPIRLVASSSDSSVQVQLTGDDARYFTMNFGNNQVTIAPSGQLTDAVLKEKGFFLLGIKADKPTVGAGETLLVLSVMKNEAENPRFEKTVYEGTITESGLLDVATVRIEPGSYVQGLDFSYSGDVSLVSISADSSGVITILSNVTPEKLADKSYILVSIVARLENEEVAHAVVIAKVLRSPVVLPKFVSPFLEGELIAKTLEVRLPNVEFVRESISSATKISIIDSQYFFDIQEYFPENVFRLYLRGNVTRELLQGIDQIPLTVEASNPNTEKTYCIVSVKVVRAAAPKFERLIYDGMIDESKQLTQDVYAKLSSDTADDTAQYAIEGEDASFFVLNTLVPVTEGVRITLRAPLTDNEFESREHFQFTLSATQREASVSALVPVIVYVKKPYAKIPKFQKPLYKSRVNNELKLVPFEQITLEQGSYVDSATVAIRNSNTDLFIVQRQQGIITIQLAKELDETSVNGVSRFEFLIECTNPGMASGFTTILVDVDHVVTPEFSQLIYTGMVDENGKEINFDNNISLLPQTIVPGTQYSIIGDDSSLVRYTESSDQHILSVYLRDEVTPAQLKLRSEIGFVIVASNPGNNQTSLASCSVKIIRQQRPAFTSSSFHGKIVEGQTVVDFGETPIAWESESVKDTTKFTVIDAESNNFFEAMDPGSQPTVTIRLRSGIKWDQVRSNAYYRLILQAETPGSEPSQCSLIIDVENTLAVTPVFTKSIYRGSLQQGTREVIFSAGDTITVQSSTILPTFQYSASEGDADFFVVELFDSNKFRVSLNDSIPSVAIEGRDLLSFIMTINNAYSADDTATIVVTLKLDDIIVPAFSKLLYSGSVMQGSSDLTLPETITLGTGTFSENTEVGIGGIDAALFAISRVGSIVELTIVADSINWSELISRSYFSIFIQATNPGSESATAFVVIDVKMVRQPQFAQTHANGHIEIGGRDVIFAEGSELRIVESSTEPGYQWNLAGDDYQLFDGLLVDDLFKFKLNETVSEEQLGSRTRFKFTVTLKNPNSNTIESTVIVSRELPTPVFSKPLYTGSFDTDLRLVLPDTIAITEESFSAGVLVTVNESNVDFLSIEQTGRQVVLRLSRSLSLADFQGLQLVHLSLVAKAATDIEGTCSLVLTIPDGSPCTPLPPIVDCSGCLNCTTGGTLEDVPVFAYGNYRFQLRSDTSGIIGSVTATVKDPTAVVQHRLDGVDAYLKPHLSITNEGTLSIAEPIIPKVYQFLVHATNSAAGKQSTASVVLDVLNEYECTEGEKKITVEQVLQVEHLDEEMPHGTIFPTRISPSCAYELISEYPTDPEQAYFYIDAETNWLASRSFDRENELLFGGMTVPQFKLILKLQCQQIDESNETVRRSIVRRSLVETDTINYASDITVISIIVDDVNDNDPVFTQPDLVPGNTEHIGFPEPSLATKLMLTELTLIQATDADEGLNAKIRYSLAENDHFTIDPHTGSIYPVIEALRNFNQMELSVTATDCDGAVYGRSTTIALNVHRLSEDQIAFLTIANGDGTAAAEIIEQINRQSTIKLKVLRQAFIPELERPSQIRAYGVLEGHQAGDSKSAVRLLVYALDDNHQPYHTDAIRSAIRMALPELDASAIRSFNEAVCYANGNPSCPSCPDELTGSSSNTGLIAATSVLGGLLLICLIVGSVLYMRFLRPLGKNSTDSSSDIVQLENDFDPSPPSSPTNLGMRKEQDTYATEEKLDRKISINIAGITMQESEDTNQLARSLTNRLDEEDEYGTVQRGASPSEPSEPKNVKFNEVVERIEVQEHHSEDEDESSVYEERL